MYRGYGITNVGNYRLNNEDHFLINKKVINEGDFLDNHLCSPCLLAVADGMGGTEGGERASKEVLDHLTQILPSEENILTSVKKSNGNIYQYGRDHPKFKGMGTTLTGIYFENEEVYSFHIGDSRLYKFKNGFVKQLTRDDSLAMELYDSGMLTREERDNYSQRNVILKAVGVTPELEISMEKVRGQLEAGEYLLLCTDGVSNHLSYDELETILSSNLTIDQKGKEILKKALTNHSTDNLTLILVEKRNEAGGL